MVLIGGDPEIGETTLLLQNRAATSYLNKVDTLMLAAAGCAYPFIWDLLPAHQGHAHH